ncbi:MAG: type II toxin-antitoxin system HipA family toxin [Cytophagales bacterium]|nr:type II toxin-antitoxin system HipA family toxin [Cytophagales bacterium]
MNAILSTVNRLQGHTPQGFAGDLIRESQFVWRYDTQNPEAELSLTMPLRAQSYNSHVPHPIFAMNLPEGAQYDRFQQRFAKQFSKFNEMAILSLMGQDQIGRISLRQENIKVSSAPIGLNQLLKSKANDDLFDFLLGQFYDRGISGVQPKVLVPDGDLYPTANRQTNRASAYASNLIVKTGGQDFPFLSQNEYLCMMVAKQAGLDVPEFHLSEDGNLFIMRRFDRPAPNVQLGFEDMAVLSGATYDERGHYKYRGSYEGLVRYIRHYCSANALAQTQNFFSYFALSVMLRNGDAHLKNFGLLYNHPNDAASIRLAPAFDVVTTSVYGDNTMALKLNQSNSYPTRKELIAFGKNVCLVKKPETVIERIADAMTEVSKAHGELVPRSFAKQLFEEWDQTL